MNSSLIPGRIKPNIGMIGIQFLCLTFSFKRDNVVALTLGGWQVAVWLEDQKIILVPNGPGKLINEDIIFWSLINYFYNHSLIGSGNSIIIFQIPRTLERCSDLFLFIKNNEQLTNCEMK